MNAKLPQNLTINGTVHVMAYRDANFIVYQNYSGPRPTSQQPLQDTTPQIIGQNLLHLFRIVNHDPGETLGEEVGTYTSLDAARARARQG